MRKLGWIFLLAALTAAAGGGGATSSLATVSTSSSSSSSSGATTPAVSAMSMTTSLPQIPSNNSASATITAFVRDADNNFLTGVPVTFSATSGGLAVTTATTGTNGEATASLGTAGDPTDRSITVTATAGTISATITVGVVGTTTTITGPQNLILGSPG